MKNIVKESYRGFKGWLYYMRDYKYNVENDMVSQQMLVNANMTIERLTNEIKEKEFLANEKDDLISRLNERIRILNGKITDEKVKNKLYIISIDELKNEIEDLEKEIKDKNTTIKKVNMKYAQSQRMVQKQEKDIQRKDHKINFLLASKEAPSKEKVMAYEKRMREVEKRQKEKAK